MRKRLAAMAARGWNRVGAAKRALLLGLALGGAAAVFSAPADIARGLAWLQSQVQIQGQLASDSKVAARQQAQCETATTLIKLSGSSAQVAALVASLQEPEADAVTESLACWQQLRQQLGQVILNADLQARQVEQAYVPLDGFSVANALDTGWAVRTQLQSLSGADKTKAFAWLQANQSVDGSFAVASNTSLLATAVVLRALKNEGQFGLDLVATAWPPPVSL
jgi:hypothetical protein